MTWEEAVKQLRGNTKNLQSVFDNYFEEDIFSSAERFSKSDEFAATQKNLPPTAKTLLDIGAGRGIASYAFAKTGLNVSALEPDKSNDVGSGAIKQLAQHFHLPISVTESFGEELPYDNNTFDVVYMRQVLHHAANLSQFCKEATRVLRPGGLFIATREHVISKETDIDLFLTNHPLHKLYGGEHAYTLNQYLDAIKKSGLQVKKVLHPYESVINYAPLTKEELKRQFGDTLSKVVGDTLAVNLLKNKNLFKLMCDLKSHFFRQPGRLYSFIAIKK